MRQRRGTSAAAAAVFALARTGAVRPASALVLLVDDREEHQRFDGRRGGLLLAREHLDEATHQIPRRNAAVFLRFVTRGAFGHVPRTALEASPRRLGRRASRPRRGAGSGSPERR